MARWVYFVFAVLFWTIGIYARSAQNEYNNKYHSRFDTVDLDLILASKRLVGNYVDCLMDKRPCTMEGDELKRVLPDAVETECAKCTLRQREGAKKVIRVVRQRYPEQWQTLLKKWDLERFMEVL